MRGYDSFDGAGKATLEMPAYERQLSDNLGNCAGDPATGQFVGLFRHRVGMEPLLRVKGLDLRYLLSWLLAESGSATVPELLDRLTMYGFDVDGRPSKTVSNALH